MANGTEYIDCSICGKDITDSEEAELRDGGILVHTDCLDPDQYDVTQFMEAS